MSLIHTPHTTTHSTNHTLSPPNDDDNGNTNTHSSTHTNHNHHHTTNTIYIHHHTTNTIYKQGGSSRASWPTSASSASPSPSPSCKLHIILCIFLAGSHTLIYTMCYVWGIYIYISLPLTTLFTPLPTQTNNRKRNHPIKTTLHPLLPSHLYTTFITHTPLTIHTHFQPTQMPD